MNAVDAHKFDIALNKSDDIDLNADVGSLNVVKGERELAQKVSNLLNINAGEVSWNSGLGLNQYEIFMDNGNPAIIQSEISNYLRNIFGNAFQSCSIAKIDVDKTHRSEYITLNVTLKTNHGSVTVNPDLMIGGK